MSDIRVLENFSVWLFANLLCLYYQVKCLQHVPTKTSEAQIWYDSFLKILWVFSIYRCPKYCSFTIPIAFSPFSALQKISLFKTLSLTVPSSIVCKPGVRFPLMSLMHLFSHLQLQLSRFSFQTIILCIASTRKNDEKGDFLGKGTQNRQGVARRFCVSFHCYDSFEMYLNCLSRIVDSFVVGTIVLAPCCEAHSRSPLELSWQDLHIEPRGVWCLFTQINFYLASVLLFLNHYRFFPVHFSLVRDSEKKQSSKNKRSDCCCLQNVCLINEGTYSFVFILWYKV